jgi:hypothetical protein
MLQKVKSLTAFLFIFNVPGFAQTDTGDTATAKPRWYFPCGIVTQYAGGFGMFSIGPLFKPLKKTEVAITTGYTPPSYGGIWTANFLISYSPLNVKAGKYFTLNLFQAGAFANFNFGKNIYFTWPEKYPENYYWWTSSLRFGPFINTEVKYSPVTSKNAYTFFFQCNSNDFYIASYTGNRRAISLSEILVFGIGLKITGNLF